MPPIAAPSLFRHAGEGRHPAPTSAKPKSGLGPGLRRGDGNAAKAAPGTGIEGGGNACHSVIHVRAGSAVRYIDTSVRQADQTVAWWMQQTASDGLSEFRCQSGYFTLEGSGPLLPSLKDWADRGSMLRLLLGSNRACTLASHISYLAASLGLPRPRVALGIVSFEASLFHPKVYHFVREDRSETAYVGSANFTGPGISGLNVEAGIIIDTRDGDNPAILEDIRNRIDAWFDGGEEGVSVISSPEDIERLLKEGYLSLRAVDPPPEAGLPEHGDEAAAGPARPRRSAIIKLPRFETVEAGAAGADIAEAQAPEPQSRRRFLRHTEAGFHYPQGTHLGHIVAIMWRFATGRKGTQFDDRYLRLSGSLGHGRLATFRRQIKYKILAAIEMGVVSDIRYVDDSHAYVPELTDVGLSLWNLLSPYVDTARLIMGGGQVESTRLPERPGFYNVLLRDACARSDALRALYSDTMLHMPAVSQMSEFLGSFPDRRIAKNDIYEGFFDFGSVKDFCDEMGIEPGTEEAARHRCPFLLNILESLGRIDQEASHVVRR